MTQRYEKLRFETFCDAVLAIAITLLVLEIKVPEIHSANAGSLYEAVLHRWPLMAATTMSFIAIGCYWVNHNTMMRQMEAPDHGFVLLSLLWLLAVCLIPFPTAVLGEYMLQGDSIRVAAPLYLAGIALPSLIWSLKLGYAVRRRLFKPVTDDSSLNALGRLFELGFLMHLAWVVLSLFAPWTALVLGNLQIFLYLLPWHLTRRRPGSAAA